MKKVLFGIVTSLFFALTLFVGVSAVSACGTYGGECPPSSQLVVDKLIRDPRSKGEVYVDNLTLSDYRFSPGEDILFKVVVKNTSSSTLTSVRLTDYLPVVTDYVLLSGGERSTIREVTADLGSLEPNQSKEWFLRVRVKPAQDIPSNTVCGDPNAINRAKVNAANTGDSWDTSSFCVQKTVLGTGQQPDTGAEIWIAGLLFLTLSGAGIALQKRYA